MADKYRRVDRPQPQLPMLPNEIRITSQGIRKNYISYAIDKLTNVAQHPLSRVSLPSLQPRPHIVDSLLLSAVRAVDAVSRAAPTVCCCERWAVR